jgi:hypothetical protein
MNLKSRQVLRAEFRSEIKRGAQHRKRLDRRAKQLAKAGSGDPFISSLRTAALTAVSTFRRGMWS